MKTLQEIWEALLSGETLENKSNRLTVSLKDGTPVDQNGKTAIFMEPSQWTLAPKPKKLYAYRDSDEIEFYLTEKERDIIERAPEFDIEYPIENK